MTLKLSDLKPGDRVMRLYDDGWHGSIIYADVVRVNRVTVTVRDDCGRISRVDPRYLDRKLSDLEKEQSQDWFPSVAIRQNPSRSSRALKAEVDFSREQFRATTLDRDNCGYE